jgi:hypothetical protein
MAPECVLWTTAGVSSGDAGESAGGSPTQHVETVMFSVLVPA